MIPIIKAQESISRINEMLYGTGNMRNSESYISRIQRQATSLDRAAMATDFTKMSPAERRAWVSNRFTVVK